MQLLFDLEQLEGEMERMMDHQELSETCQLQLTELEMLAAMFPQPGELKVIDPAAVAEMTEFVEGTFRELPARLDYTIAFQAGDQVGVQRGRLWTEVVQTVLGTAKLTPCTTAVLTPWTTTKLTPCATAVLTPWTTTKLTPCATAEPTP